MKQVIVVIGAGSIGQAITRGVSAGKDRGTLGNDHIDWKGIVAADFSPLTSHLSRKNLPLF
jgi:hypothetical protein